METVKMSAEEIEKKIKEAEEEIKRLNEKRIAIVQRINSFKSKVDIYTTELGIIKNREASNIDWANEMFDWDDPVKHILNEKFRIDEFRHQQIAAINAILSGKDVILLMPTGGGKSLCYQLPALVSKGITLVISPLLSLIDDQLLSLKNIGINAATINSTNSKTEGKIIFEELSSGKGGIKLLFVTPEWMAKSKRFMSSLQKCYERKGLDRIAIDEVHCISHWGHDFRPDYKFLGVLKTIFPDIPILGLTATATDAIVLDIQKILRIQGCVVLRSSYNRPNLYYCVQQKPATHEECLHQLADLIKNNYKNKSGIIYTTTINEAVELAKGLHELNTRVACYHANMDAERRQKVHERWLQNRYQVIVATVAFGMGIDKPDVRFVIHHSIPKSMENFYQESGRAGRDGKRADCLLWFSLKDMFRISSMVSTTANGTDNLYKLVDYCLNKQKCRRSVIATFFQEVWDENQCDKMCDVCSYTGRIKPMNLTTELQNIYTILDFAKRKEIRLTAIKLLDAWYRTGGSKQVRPPKLEKPSFTRRMAEKILAFLLVKGFLKEDIHFTAYSTISYISRGSNRDVDDVAMYVRRPVKKTEAKCVPDSTPHNTNETKENVKRDRESSDEDADTKKLKPCDQM